MCCVPHYENMEERRWEGKTEKWQNTPWPDHCMLKWASWWGSVTSWKMTEMAVLQFTIVLDTEKPTSLLVIVNDQFFFFKGFLFIYLILFIYFWLCWVFISVRGLSLVAASGGHSSSRCAGLSLSWPVLLRSTGSRRAGSVVVAHGPSCSVACGIFPDQGSNPCPLHWQTDPQPLRHQGSPDQCF